MRRLTVRDLDAMRGLLTEGGTAIAGIWPADDVHRELLHELEAVVGAVEAVVLAELPSTKGAGRGDPFARVADRLLTGLSVLLDPTTRGSSLHDFAAEGVVLSLEPVLKKLAAVVAPDVDAGHGSWSTSGHEWSLGATRSTLLRAGLLPEPASALTLAVERRNLVAHEAWHLDTVAWLTTLAALLEVFGHARDRVRAASSSDGAVRMPDVMRAARPAADRSGWRVSTGPAEALGADGTIRVRALDLHGSEVVALDGTELRPVVVPGPDAGPAWLEGELARGGAICVLGFPSEQLPALRAWARGRRAGALVEVVVAPPVERPDPPPWRVRPAHATHDAVPIDLGTVVGASRRPVACLVASRRPVDEIATVLRRAEAAARRGALWDDDGGRRWVVTTAGAVPPLGWDGSSSVLGCVEDAVSAFASLLGVAGRTRLGVVVALPPDATEAEIAEAARAWVRCAARAPGSPSIVLVAPRAPTGLGLPVLVDPRLPREGDDGDLLGALLGGPSRPAVTDEDRLRAWSLAVAQRGVSGALGRMLLETLGQDLGGLAADDRVKAAAAAIGARATGVDEPDGWSARELVLGTWPGAGASRGPLLLAALRAGLDGPWAAATSVVVHPRGVRGLGVLLDVERALRTLVERGGPVVAEAARVEELRALAPTRRRRLADLVLRDPATLDAGRVELETASWLTPQAVVELVEAGPAADSFCAELAEVVAAEASPTQTCAWWVLRATPLRPVTVLALAVRPPEVRAIVGRVSDDEARALEADALWREPIDGARQGLRLDIASRVGG